MSYLDGHRRRLRDRFNGSGLGAFEDHEVLELLLTYAIPRKDVKPIARALLDRFGSLSAVLDSAPASLLEVPGVGENAATLLHLVPPLTRCYLRDRWGHRPRLTTPADIAAFAVDQLAADTNEVFLVIGLTHEGHLIQADRLQEGTVNAAPVYPRLVVEAVLRMRAAGVVLAHNHPGGVASPSDADKEITVRLRDVLLAIGIPLRDHVIVAGPRTFSFAEAGLLQDHEGGE